MENQNGSNVTLMGGSTAALGSATEAYSMGLLILLAYPVMFLISPLPLMSPPPL